MMSTISKVAEKAGVSRTTVSHVINHADRVSPHLRERVERAIAELGYQPNAMAKSLRTGRTNNIALLIPDIRNPFYTEMVNTAQGMLLASGREALIFNADVPGGDARVHSRHYLSQIRSRGIDGLIVGDFALHGMYEAVGSVEVPLVFVGTLPDGGVDNVKADDRGGSYRMGQYLARRGYRRVAHVTGPSDFPAAVMRREGFRQGLIDGGLPEDLHIVHEGSYLSPSGVEGVRAVLSVPEGERPDALFFSNHLMSIGGMAAIHDMGLRVPEDIAVAVFGNHPPMNWMRPKLTHVGVNPGDLARAACRLLLDRLDGGADAPPRTEVIDCTFVEGDSA